MSSSQSSNQSPGEECYYTAEEDPSCFAQSSSGASSAVTTTPNGSVYATANQTPTASPDIRRGTASLIPTVAQDQGQIEAVRPIEGSPKAPRGPFFTSGARPSTFSARQRAFLMQQSKSGESENEDDAPDSLTGEALNEPSRLWTLGPGLHVNDSPPMDLVDTHEDNHTARRDTSDLSYPYRPTPIDVDPQQESSLPTSPSSNNTTSPLISYRTTDTHQGLEPIKEDEMPYDPFGNFIMNPLAPVFVPRQGGQPSQGGQLGQGSQPMQGGRPATRARNPGDWVYYGAAQPELPAAPTPEHVPLFGAAHGMSYEPRTGLFTGDGPPRTTPYRADGTLPSQPDRQDDFLTSQQYPTSAEDQMHIQPRREYVDRMAGFGRNGPVQRFRIARPTPQGPAQEGMRVMVQREEGQGQEGRSGPFGRGMRTADHDDEDDGSEGGMWLHGRRVDSAEEAGAELSRLLGRIARGDPVERELQADEGRVLEDDEETMVDASEEGPWYVGPP